MKEKIFKILSPSEKTGDLSWFIDVFIIILILANVAAVVVESVESISLQYKRAFQLFELFSIVVFSVEYVLRLWTANAILGYEKPIIGNLKYSLTPFALVDLLAILPFYMPFTGVDLRLIRILRFARIIRLFKIGRYLQALSFIGSVISKKREELFVALMMTLVLLLIASSLMFFVEHKAQPEQFSSIPKTMWWGIITLTTVGYGDIYPITPLGQFFGGVIAFIGIGIFALPTGIMASGFSEEIARRHNSIKTEALSHCPTCGQKIEGKCDD